MAEEQPYVLEAEVQHGMTRPWSESVLCKSTGGQSVGGVPGRQLGAGPSPCVTAAATVARFGTHGAVHVHEYLSTELLLQNKGASRGQYIIDKTSKYDLSWLSSVLQ